jgi:hypothetical protein
LFALDAHGHLFCRGHHIKHARAAQVDDDACYRGLGLEMTYPDLEHIFGMHGDVAYGCPHNCIVEINH